MAIQRRRTDGFSEDGLSYSVASDFDKQIGQALADREARIADPRYIPGAQVERPDAPDILDRELIDPVMMAFGLNPGGARNMSGRSAPAADRDIFRNVGGNLVKINPASGSTEVAFQPEDKRMANWKLDNLKAEASALRATLNDPFKSQMLGADGKSKAASRLAEINKEAETLFTPVPDTAPKAPSDLLQPSGFMGAPGGANLFSSPTRTATQAAPVLPGQVGNAPAPAQRQKGQTYNTPRGPMKWTGTGWVQP